MLDPEVEELLGPAGSPGPAAAPPRASHPTRARGGDLAMVGGAYDGASRFDGALALWQPGLQSADAEILPAKGELDARARDTLRNDAYVAGGAALHKDNIVGSMFVLNSKPNLQVLGLDETFEEEFQAEVEAKFTLWAESLDNWVDASRMGTLTDLVRLAVGVFVAGGEVLASAEWIREPGSPYSTAIQMVDTDRLSNPYYLPDDGNIRAGVERNRFGAPQAYHIRAGHPSDWMNADSYVWKRVPARKPWGRPQIIHIIDQMRPDQTRGVSEMTAALKELRITKKFRDVVLQNAVVNSTYAASIESDLPAETVFSQLDGREDLEAGITQYATSFLAAINQYAGGAKNLQIDGVRIPHLFPGTKLQLRPAGKGGPLGSEFEQSLLRYIAATLGVSYEELSRDYTNTNYSSARAAMNNTWKFMQSRKRKVADRFASTVFRLWLEEAINKGEITSMPRRGPSIYDGMALDAYAACDWIGASRGQIDELKETQAAALRIKLGLSTQEDEAARTGKDWRKINAQQQREAADRAARGLPPLGVDVKASADTAKPGDQQNA